MRDHIEGFIVSRSYAAASAKQRRYLLNTFCDAVGGDLTVPSVYRWWGSLGDLAPASRRAHLSAVRQFMRHLIVIGVLDADPTASIATPRVPASPPVTIPATDVARLLGNVTNPQDRVAVALMVGCGLRGGDVARLDVADVNLSELIVRVEGKGGKVRLVPIPHVVAMMLAAHCNDMSDGPLIRCPDGHRMSAEQLRWRITRELQRAGIKRAPLDGRSSHVLRRTCATALLEAGTASLVDVQHILGHSELSSTQRYLALPDAKRLQAVIETGPLSAA